MKRMTKLITKAEAKEQGLKYYFTGKPCKHGHTATRFVSTRACTECMHIRDTSDEAKAYHKVHGKAYRADPTNKARKAKYNKANLPKFAAHKAKYHAGPAAPKWLSKEQLKEIEDIYKLAKCFSLATGRSYHVDHIVPINSDTVCGLHVPANLQILEATDNLTKYNKYCPDGGNITQ